MNVSHLNIGGGRGGWFTQPHLPHSIIGLPAGAIPAVCDECTCLMLKNTLTTMEFVQICDNLFENMLMLMKKVVKYSIRKEIYFAHCNIFTCNPGMTAAGRDPPPKLGKLTFIR